MRERTLLLDANDSFLLLAMRKKFFVREVSRFLLRVMSEIAIMAALRKITPPNSH